MRTGVPVRLHVETFNRALRLYERLGFRPIAESSIYLEMEWNAPSQDAFQNEPIQAQGVPHASTI